MEGALEKNRRFAKSVEDSRVLLYNADSVTAATKKA
jgi:hypothetical protein